MPAMGSSAVRSFKLPTFLLPTLIVVVLPFVPCGWVLAGDIFTERRNSIVWSSSYESALEEAQVDGKVVMVDFFTDWCTWCRRLDSDTYSDSAVVARAKRFVCIKVNAERRSDLASRYGVRAYPSIAFLHPDGALAEMVRGYLPPSRFAAVLDRIGDATVERFSLTQRLMDHPDLIDVRQDLARLLMRTGKTAEALAQIDTCLRAAGAPDDGRRWDLRLDRGRALLMMGQFREARKDLKAFTGKRKRSPRHAEAVFFYAEACFADGDRNEARKYYRKLLAEKPEGWLADKSRTRLDELG